MKNLTVKSALLIPMFYAATAAAAGAAASSVPAAGAVTGSGAAVNGASPAQSNGVPATSSSGGYGSMPQVTTSPSSPYGSSAYGTGASSEGMTGPGGAVGTTTNPNFGVSSGTTTIAPGYSPDDAGAAADWHNPSATAPVYRQPLNGQSNTPNSVGTSITNPPSGTSTNLGY